jgi:hypothetical protein
LEYRSKVEIYKSFVRPSLRNSAETRGDTSNTYKTVIRNNEDEQFKEDGGGKRQ